MFDIITKRKFKERKYILQTFYKTYFEEKILFSFKEIHKNHYGEFILKDLKIEKQVGDDIVTLDGDKFIFLNDITWKYDLKINQNELENNIFDDLETAELLFEIGE